MRKLEAVVQEITDEFGYLKRREMRMRDTNGKSPSTNVCFFSDSRHRIDPATSAEFCLGDYDCVGCVGCMANCSLAQLFPTEISH